MITCMFKSIIHLVVGIEAILIPQASIPPNWCISKPYNVVWVLYCFYTYNYDVVYTQYMPINFVYHTCRLLLLEFDTPVILP